MEKSTLPAATFAVFICAFAMGQDASTAAPAAPQPKAPANNGPAGAPAKKDHAKPSVAKSQEELGQLLAAALDDEDYDAVAQLMASVAMLKDMGEPEKDQKAYAEYLLRIPQLAKQYRELLDKNEMLPLKKQKFSKKGNEGPPRPINGKAYQFSSGVYLILGKDRGGHGFEFIDQAVAVDGRWYIGHLCMESVEREFKDGGAIVPPRQPNPDKTSAGHSPPKNTATAKEK